MRPAAAAVPKPRPLHILLVGDTYSDHLRPRKHSAALRRACGALRSGSRGLGMELATNTEFPTGMKMAKVQMSMDMAGELVGKGA